MRNKTATIIMFMPLLFLFMVVTDVSYAQKKLKTPFMKKPGLSHPVARKVYTVKAGDAYNYAKSHGFVFTASKNDPTSQCEIFSVIEPNYNYIRTEAKSSPLSGSRCDFVLFGRKQLNNGWIYYRNTFSGDGCQTAQGNPRGGNKGYRINKKPGRGDRSAEYKFHQWNEATGITLSELSRTCSLTIYDISLEGPDNATWQAAFR